MNAADEITRSSRSNLALALRFLPADRRADMRVLYAFCRVVDDIADEPGHPVEWRMARLGEWRRWLVAGTAGEPALAVAVRGVRDRRKIPAEYFTEILAGVGMDLEETRYLRFEDLRLYCYRVAGAVGLASIEVFGHSDPRCREYAEVLGLGLQLTNIVRDVGIDWANGKRVYLPSEDLDRFGVLPGEWLRDAGRFRDLMAFEADRAGRCLAEAGAILPPQDARNMIAAEIMRSVYGRLLGKIVRSGFPVIERRCSLNLAEKLLAIAGAILRVYRIGRRVSRET